MRSPFRADWSRRRVVQKKSNRWGGCIRMFWNLPSECVAIGHKTASPARECCTSWTSCSGPTRSGAATISIEEPDITRPVRSPVNIRIRFQAAANARIEVNTLRVRYGRLGIDLTRRILAHARPTSSGVFVEDAELPRGRHRVTIQIADNMGRVGSKSFDFNVV